MMSLLHIIKRAGRYKSTYCCYLNATKAVSRCYSKVPKEPTWVPITDENLPPPTSIEPELVDYLERIALVDFSNQEAVERLNAAIRFADQLFAVNTEGVVPQHSVLEDQSLFLRKDEVTEGHQRDELLKLAKKREDDYYVAPPGNIPLSKNSTKDSNGNSEECSERQAER